MIAHIIALRNLIKNRYRTLLSMGMIIGALVAISVFRGYVLRTLEIVQTTIVNGQFGHLQLAKKSYWEQSFKSKKESMLVDSEKLIEEIEHIPNVTSASPRSKFYGLISTDKISDSAMLIGINADKEPDFTVGLTLLDGDKFDVSNRRVMLGNLLAKRLKIKKNDEVTIVSTTLDQVVNAMDFQVGGIVATGTEDFDSIAAFINIEDAQKILGTSQVDVLKISVRDIKNVDQVQAILNEKYKASGLLSKTWLEISSLFRKVQAFYDTQTGLMFCILVFIIILGLSNTVSMSLNERIGEIGTLRALGQSQKSLLGQFMLESFYLCLVSLGIGAFLARILIAAINAADIKTEIPGASLPVKIDVGFYWDVVAWVSLALFAIVNISTAILIYRYVRIRIVEALRHNI